MRYVARGTYKTRFSFKFQCGILSTQIRQEICHSTSNLILFLLSFSHLNTYTAYILRLQHYISIFKSLIYLGVILLNSIWDQLHKKNNLFLYFLIRLRIKSLFWPSFLSKKIVLFRVPNNFHVKCLFKDKWCNFYR